MVLIAVILVIVGLRLARGVLMPLGVAVFIVFLAWPLQTWLEKRLPRGLSAAVTVLVILFVFALLGCALWLCAIEIAAKSDAYRVRLESLVASLEATVSHWDLPESLKRVNLDQASQQLLSFVGGFAMSVYEVIGYLVLVAAFLVLLLIDVHPLQRQIEDRLRKEVARKLIDSAQNAAASVRRFMLTRTMTSAITGMLTGLYTWRLGLDFPFVWALTAFVLNFVPVLGSIVAVIPPVLVALVLPEAAWRAPATLGGLSVIQFTVGNYVDPLLQSRFLSLPAWVLFLSIVFWGWTWGIPGALVAVPMTLGLVIACDHFESSRWVAQLLVRRKE